MSINDFKKTDEYIEFLKEKEEFKKIQEETKKTIETLKKEKQDFEIEKKQFQKQKFIKDGGNEDKFNEYIKKVEKAKKIGLDTKDLNLSSFFTEKPFKDKQIQEETKKPKENVIPSLNKNKDTKINKGDNSKKSTRVVFNE